MNILTVMSVLIAARSASNVNRVQMNVWNAIWIHAWLKMELVNVWKGSFSMLLLGLANNVTLTVSRAQKLVHAKLAKQAWLKDWRNAYSVTQVKSFPEMPAQIVNLDA